MIQLCVTDFTYALDVKFVDEEVKRICDVSRCGICVVPLASRYTYSMFVRRQLLAPNCLTFTGD